MLAARCTSTVEAESDLVRPFFAAPFASVLGVLSIDVVELRSALESILLRRRIPEPTLRMDPRLSIPFCIGDPGGVLTGVVKPSFEGLAPSFAEASLSSSLKYGDHPSLKVTYIAETAMMDLNLSSVAHSSLVDAASSSIACARKPSDCTGVDNGVVAAGSGIL